MGHYLPTPPLKYPYCQWTYNWLFLSILQSASCKVWAGKRWFIYQKVAKISPYVLHMPKEQMWECFLRVSDQGGLNVALSSVQFIPSVVSNSVTPWTAAYQASLSITNSRSLPKLMSIELVMPSNYRLNQFLKWVNLLDILDFIY